jgi:ribosomal protein S19E (S16A)
METFAFVLCSVVLILISMAVINKENKKEFNISRENLQQLENFGYLLSRWKQGKHKTINKQSFIRKKGGNICGYPQ